MWENVFAQQVTYETHDFHTDNLNAKLEANVKEIN